MGIEEITIIGILYILTVFLNRHLNKVLYTTSRVNKIIPPLWFLSLACTVSLLVVILSEREYKSLNWFSGKHWKKNDES